MAAVDELRPGARIGVVQTIRRRAGEWTTEVVGTVVAVRDAPTGSWHAHGKGGRYWLKRVELRKDDGELTLLSLDESSRVFFPGGEPPKVGEPNP